MKQTLISGLHRLNIELNDDQIDRLTAFGEAVIEKNRVMNLTAITEPAAVAERHLLDSLTVLRSADLRDKSLLDVGTGAGFPGVPLKIAEPTLRLTLLDSLQKRLRWLETEALPPLGVDAAFLVGRAEELVRDRRESFDCVTARGVANLSVLCELCLPFVRPGGSFLALKGDSAAAEAQTAETALKILGGVLERTDAYEIAGTVHRILVIRKVKSTPAQYPRPFAKIKQRPL